MPSPKRLARIAGLFYLLVAVLGGPPQLFVRASVRVAGDPAATADNVLANASLLRVAFVGELVAIVFHPAGHGAVPAAAARRPRAAWARQRCSSPSISAP